MYGQILTFIAEQRLGDLASIAGVFISVIGFIVTFIGVRRSRTAAEMAAQASIQTRNNIKLFETVSSFSSVISSLEEVKRIHRTEHWLILPDKYSELRKVLVGLRAANQHLSEEGKSAIQSTISNLLDIESKVERGLKTTASLDSVKFNKIVSGDIDRLTAMLEEIKLKWGDLP
ncbi:hypothetical protein NK718_12255 [Alsobacter sp. SYSU M60028]|uniref:Uncharacterized protein n=1 Tax=Alsobacter ponti TaxID=2962936 RepID=A0ABT1LEX3_9HYPH|nr:hypothetical protein [Alsobacter ponti]MCP8939290.1 hypothetical protein [Alsobacter ponti]